MKMAKEGSPNEHLMLLVSCDQINSGEGTINREVQGRHTDLRHVHVNFLLSMSAADLLTINDWKAEALRQGTVDATLGSACINQALDAADARRWRLRRSWFKGRIKSYVNEKRRTVDS